MFSRQGLRRFVADFLDSKAEEKPLQGFFLGFFNPGEQGRNGLIAPAIQGFNLFTMLVKLINIGDIMDEILTEEFLDHRFPHSVDIHRVARSKMDHALNLSAGAFGVQAIMEALHFG